MFYVKGKLETIAIEEDNVFTTCPICGEEFSVDLLEVLVDGHGDLYGTNVYCNECSKVMLKQKSLHIEK